MFIRNSGTKSWSFRFRQDGKLREMSLGPLTPANDLREAREKAANARNQVHNGQNPLAKKHQQLVIAKEERLSSRTFGDVLSEFFEAKDRTGFYTSDRTRRRWYHCLNTHARSLHGLPLNQMKTVDIYRMLEPIWVTKTETASRTRLYVEAVLSWAKTMGYREGENPATWRGNLDQLLAPKNRVSPVQNHPGMSWQDIPAFYKELQASDLPAARLLEFIVLTAARSGEARGAIWDEIDLIRNVWEIPAKRMKMKRPHLVPIQGRMIELLDDAYKFRMNELVFPNPRSGKEYSYNAPMVVLKKLGVSDLTVHGFRSSFKTWALENTIFPTQAVEYALAHETRNAVEGVACSP